MINYIDNNSLFNKNKIKLVWGSCLDCDFSKYYYDLVLTSPPYINMELYEKMIPFESDKKYYEEFLIPMLHKSYKYLINGGNMCINISPKIYKQLTEKYNYNKCDLQIDLRQMKKSNYVIKSRDYLYVWKK